MKPGPIIAMVLLVVAALALTLGIGLTATMFSIVYGALLRGLPYEESDRIVHIEQNNLAMDFQSLEVSVHDYVDYRDQQRSFDELAAVRLHQSIDEPAPAPTHQ